MVYDQGWEARNIDQLERRLVQKMEEIDVNVVQSMFSGIRKTVKRKIAEHGPYEACSFQFPIEETLLFPVKYDTRSLNVAFE